MREALLAGLGFAALAAGALPFVHLLADYPAIALASLAFVALTAGGYEIARRRNRRP